MTTEELVRDLTKVHPLPKSEVRKMLTDFIEETTITERERCLSIIEEFSDRNDGPILEDIGKSAPYPAPCARKTCNILADRIKHPDEINYDGTYINY